jgi:excisionase family DNA binding protein
MSKKRETEELEELLTVREVKSILGVSYGVIYALINYGRLRCWKVTGEPVNRHDVGESTWGPRFRPSDVRQFLQEQLVK